MSIADDTKKEMEKKIEHFKTELKNLRTSRANPGMVEGVMVDVYGSHMRIKELASITAPESRQLLISPFDPQTAGVISKSIEKANLNLQPILDKGVIRINIPPMDESMRKQIVKQGKDKAEAAKISMRDVRRQSNEAIKKESKEGSLTEDEVKKAEKKIQEHTDHFCKEIDKLFEAKEKEIMAV